LEETEKLSS